MRTREHLAHRHDVDDEVTVTDRSDWSLLLRVLAMVAAAVPVVIGLIAVARLDWFGQGWSSPPVDVAGMTFVPGVAIGTLVAGLLAFAAAATNERESKFAIGGLLVCIGIVILVAGGTADRLDLEDGHGWLAILVGAVLIGVAVLMREGWRTSRVHREVEG